MTFVTAATMSSASPQRVDREVEGGGRDGRRGGGGSFTILSDVLVWLYDYQSILLLH